MPQSTARTAQGPWVDLALHTIGWRAFQDLCSQVLEVVLNTPVEIFREAQDGGQDAVFQTIEPVNGASRSATIQCKHSSDPYAKLKLSDLTPELDNVRSLVASGNAHTYVFMCNMAVDAPVAVAIRDKLSELGVVKPHIFGKHFLTRAIKSSAKLRALVPQVYGLGDLTSILDERLSQQSLALLEDWIPTLKRYVPTVPHRKAVEALEKHGAVLLLGNPSSGKSAIGAILATLACEQTSESVFIVNSPRQFEDCWNVNEPKRFFWIDDAFGANVPNNDFIQEWIVLFPKMQSAIKRGARFLFTSRTYIYAAARKQIGGRNLSFLHDGSAVVHVGDLTPEEKSQILYNHIVYGNQTVKWKSQVKPFLDAVSEVSGFLPGIAERLGNPDFTKSLALNRESLISFMKEPREHLVQTLDELSNEARAALFLLYVHEGTFDPGKKDAQAVGAISQITSVEEHQMYEALDQLRGSFVKNSSINPGTWSYSHPTISDACTFILKRTTNNIEALLRGTKPENILREFVCERSFYSQTNAMVIPSSLDEILVRRLLSIPDQEGLNTDLFAFLSRRASDTVFKRILSLKPDLFTLQVKRTSPSLADVRVRLYARAHSLDILPDEFRDEIVRDLKDSAIDEFDLSFFEDDKQLSLFDAKDLLSLGFVLRGDWLDRFRLEIARIGENADERDDADSTFYNVSCTVEHLSSLNIDSHTHDLLEKVEEEIAEETERLSQRNREAEDAESDSDWTWITGAAKSDRSPLGSNAEAKVRSIFSDVDRLT